MRVGGGAALGGLLGGGAMGTLLAAGILPAGAIAPPLEGVTDQAPVTGWVAGVVGAVPSTLGALGAWFVARVEGSSKPENAAITLRQMRGASLGSLGGALAATVILGLEFGLWGVAFGGLAGGFLGAVAGALRP